MADPIHSSSPSSQWSAWASMAYQAKSRLVFALVILVAVSLFASTRFPIEVVSVAAGEVTPSGQVKRIQHLEGGIVSEVLVEEGQQVSQGDVLMRFEGVSATADMRELGTYLASLRLDILRLEAEQRGADSFQVSEDLARRFPSLVQESKALLKSRRDRVRGMQEALRLQREQVAISEQLLKSEIQSRLSHLSVLREENQLEGRLQDYRQEVSTQLAKANKDLAEKDQRMLKYTDSVDRNDLRTPVTGEVKVVYFKTKGGVVPPGGVVMEVVPTGEKLVIEVKLPVGDVGYVQIGQTANLRLASRDAIRFGSIEGRVVYVSPDSSTGEAQQQGPYYRVRIETSADRFESAGQSYRLIPGVQVIASIITGNRSLFSYFMSPFLSTSATAFRERS
jgi:membrane fusion protein, adhesin transport system